MKKSIHNMKKSVLNIALFTTVVLQVSCGSDAETPVQLSSEKEPLAPVSYTLTKKQFESSQMTTGELEMKTFHDIIKAKGMIDVPPTNKAAISSYYSGTVKDVQVLSGEKVKNGQVLFTLENPDFVKMQQDYLEAKGQLTYLKSDYDRQKSLMADKVASEKHFLKAESDYIVTKVKMESLGKQLSLMGIHPEKLRLDNIQTVIPITATINGFVTEVNISKGSFLNPSQAAITLVNTDHLHLELNVFEQDISKVKIGQAIQFIIQGDNSKKHEAVVHLINKTVHPTNRTVGIHGHLANETTSTTFNPGMYVEAEIHTTSICKSALPENTLVESEGKYFALVLTDTVNNTYNFVKKEIQTGATHEGYTEILDANDFTANTQFLTNGGFNLITE